MTLARGKNLVVIDCETTGLGNHDRIVEIAAVTVDVQTGEVLDEFDTLVNPQRDVGPTGIHGITPSMVEAAPVFAEIVAVLSRRIHGSVLAAHNLSFDARMLFLEFDRLGVPTDFGAGFCTFLATREKLLAACHRYGIDLPQQHRALADARATANLAMRLIDEETYKQLTNARIGHVPHALNPRTLRRMDEAEVSDMARIVSHSTFPHSDEAILHYLDALDWVLDDQHIDDQERSEMNQLAEDLGISDSARRQAHRSYLTSIIAAAERDGVVTDAEEHLIKQVMRALDLAEVELPTVTNLPQATSLQAGMRVCFTGTVVVAGVEFSRARLEEFASQLGMQPVSGVTKKRCDLLVAADTSSGSGKARQAKKFGIPIVSATTFVEQMALGTPKRS